MRGQWLQQTIEDSTTPLFLRNHRIDKPRLEDIKSWDIINLCYHPEDKSHQALNWWLNWLNNVLQESIRSYDNISFSITKLKMLHNYESISLMIANEWLSSENQYGSNPYGIQELITEHQSLRHSSVPGVIMVLLHGFRTTVTWFWYRCSIHPLLNGSLSQTNLME